jgi:WD40 repeat protein
VRFDPLSSRVVASASVDGSVFITSCYEPELDAKSTAGPFGNVQSEFGEVLYKFNTSAWINTLSFSPSGQNFVFACKYFR